MSTRRPGHTSSRSYFTVTVRLLEDDAAEEVHVPDDATGKWLFEEICHRQGVTEEREYFGLRFLEHELLSTPTKQWIDLTRRVASQLKHTHPCMVSFRIKHYPAVPMMDLKLPKTQYLLYRQLRRDLCSGRLVARPDLLYKMAALVVQVELGDASVQDPPQVSSKGEAGSSYVSDLQVLHCQNAEVERIIAEEHAALEGLLPSEAASELVRLASSLETYGIDPVRVKVKTYGSRPIHLGLTHEGVAEFVNNRRQKLYPWNTITWMTCDGKHFIIALSQPSTAHKKRLGV